MSRSLTRDGSAAAVPPDRSRDPAGAVVAGVVTDPDPLPGEDPGAARPRRSPRRLSDRQVEALTQVEAGRIEWGAEYPRIARRQGVSIHQTFLIDGHGVYGGQHHTFAALSEAGLIVARVDLVETRAVPARTVTRTRITGIVETDELPAGRVPVDPGWRAAVRLTEQGRAALARAREPRTPPPPDAPIPVHPRADHRGGPLC